MSDNSESTPDSTEGSPQIIQNVNLPSTSRNSGAAITSTTPVEERQNLTGEDQVRAIAVGPDQEEIGSVDNSPSLSPSDATRSTAEISESEESQHSTPSNPVQSSGLPMTSPETSGSQPEERSAESGESQFDSETDPSESADSQSGISLSSLGSAENRAGTSARFPESETSNEGISELSRNTPLSRSNPLLSGMLTGQSNPVDTATSAISKPLDLSGFNLPSVSNPDIATTSTSTAPRKVPLPSGGSAAASKTTHASGHLKNPAFVSSTAAVLQSATPISLLTENIESDLPDLSTNSSNGSETSVSPTFSMNIPNLESESTDSGLQSILSQQQPFEYDHSNPSLTSEKCSGEISDPKMSSQSSSPSPSLNITVAKPKDKSDQEASLGSGQSFRHASFSEKSVKMEGTSSNVDQTGKILRPTSSQTRTVSQSSLEADLSDSEESKSLFSPAKRRRIRSGDGSTASISANTVFLRSAYLRECLSYRNNLLGTELENEIDVSINLNDNDQFEVNRNIRRSTAFQDSSDDILKRLLDAFFEFADIVAFMDFHTIGLTTQAPLQNLSMFLSDFEDSNSSTIEMLNIEEEFAKLFPNEASNLQNQIENMWNRNRILVQFLAKLVLKMIRLPFSLTLDETILRLCNYHELINKLLGWIRSSRIQSHELDDSVQQKSILVHVTTMINEALQILSTKIQRIKGLRF